MSVKSDEDHFADWHASTFAFGYGSGEPHIIPALREFLQTCPDEGSYNYEALEAALGPVVAWLLINTLCNADTFDYGTSPRYAWLTPQGRALRSFVVDRSVDDLLAVVMKIHDEGYVQCGYDYCNCDGGACENPFWRTRRDRAA